MPAERLPLGGDRQDRRPEPDGGVPRRPRERLGMSLTTRAASMSDQPPPNSTATLYVMPASHPSVAARPDARAQGEYARCGRSCLHGPSIADLGFPGPTNRRLARHLPCLDVLVPEPLVFPREAERRTGAQEAERWGEQGAAGLSAADRGPSPPLPPGRPSAGTAGPGPPTRRCTATSTSYPRSGSRESVDRRRCDRRRRGQRGRLPATPRARLLMTIEELLPGIEPRGAAALARRLAPACPSRFADVPPRSGLAACADATPGGTCSAASSMTSPSS